MADEWQDLRRAVGRVRGSACAAPALPWCAMGCRWYSEAPAIDRSSLIPYYHQLKTLLLNQIDHDGLGSR